MIKIQIRSNFGLMLFERESEKNTIKETAEKTNLSGADLSEADLSRADLSEADLSRANLSMTNLSGADLSEADLSEADLSRANLSGANLSRADLSEANLSGANLSRANLSGANLPIFCKWNVTIIDGKIKIGCKEMSVEDWVKWFASNEEFETKRGSDEFNRIHAMFIAYSSYLKFLNSK